MKRYFFLFSLVAILSFSCDAQAQENDQTKREQDSLALENLRFEQETSRQLLKIIETFGGATDDVRLEEEKNYDQFEEVSDQCISKHATFVKGKTFYEFMSEDKNEVGLEILRSYAKLIELTLEATKLDRVVIENRLQSHEKIVALLKTGDIDHYPNSFLIEMYNSLDIAKKAFREFEVKASAFDDFMEALVAKKNKKGEIIKLKLKKKPNGLRTKRLKTASDVKAALNAFER